MVAFHHCGLAKLSATRSTALRACVRNPVERQAMIEGFIRGLRQPESVHVLLNPLPVYGLLISWLGLIAAVISTNRRAQIVTLILVFLTSISVWPVFESGQLGYDRALPMPDDDSHAWLAHRA